CLQYDGEPLTF
nr:immunoglobulin light chain junction region [Macaca mulatta]MOV37340.1 immunoglobulin light chain junction region [Macaca mulatta]MOV37341.1 immunoglobulin light chain junction region [Macaca mulatta]MOV37374.1 immunoglobulin light chain junction region [Macaca mulatta]MOV37408.1 immunoglobulin light chain junction region [Macaca mulatta]